MTKKLISLVLLLSMLFCSGCQLAREDKQELNEDRLIGVYLTRNRMYEQAIEGEGKFYANLLPHENGGHLHYVFDQLTGVPYYAGPTQFPGSKEAGLEFYAEDTLVDGHSSLHVGGGFYDGENPPSQLAGGIELRGKIGIVPGSMDILTVNRVFQSPDGRIYLLRSHGIGLNQVPEGEFLESTVSSFRMAEMKKIYLGNGQETEAKTEVDLEIAFINPTVHVKVLEMDQENKEISAKEYAVEQLPEEIIPSENTAYLLVECEIETPAGKIIKRQTNHPYDKKYSENNLEIFVARDDGFIRKIQIPIAWQEGF